MGWCYSFGRSDTCLVTTNVIYGVKYKELAKAKGSDNKTTKKLTESIFALVIM